MQFKTNPVKVVVALHLAIDGARSGVGPIGTRPMTVRELLQRVFEADVVHMNIYGRPVTGDVYEAEAFGFAGKTARKIINDDKVTRAWLGEFDSRYLDHPLVTFENGHIHVQPAGDPFYHVSDSDRWVLSSVLHQFWLGQIGVDPAYGLQRYRKTMDAAWDRSLGGIVDLWDVVLDRSPETKDHFEEAYHMVL